MRSTDRDGDAREHTAHSQEAQVGQKRSRRRAVKVAVHDHRTVGRERKGEALREAQEELGTRIAEGSADLSQATEGLRRELAERRQTEEALRRSQHELTIRNRIAQIFLTVPDEEMYAEVLQVVLEALESKHGVFGYVDEDGALVCPSMTRDIWNQCQIPDKDIVFPRETWGGVWGRALTEKRALWSNESYRVPEGHIPVRRSVAVPIVHHERIIGLLHAANKPSDYDARDRELLQTIAGSIAPILSARLERDRQERGRRQTEDALRASEERLRTVVSNAPVVLWAMDRDGVCTLSEGRGLQALKLNPGQVVGQSIFEMYADHPDILEAVRQTLAGEELHAIADVGGVILESRHCPLRDENGQVTGVIAVSTDITERHRAEQALRDSERRLHTVVTHAPVVLFAIDQEGVLTVSEGEGLRALGLEAGEHAGLSIFDLYAHSPEMIEGARRVLSGEAVSTTLDVAGVRFDVRCTPLRDQNGEVSGAIGVATEVTERERAEQALRESEERFRDLYENAPNACFSVGTDGLVRRCNRRAGELLGYAMAELVGRPVLELYADTPQGKPRASKLFERFLAGKTIRDQELQMQRADGTLVWISLTVNAVLDSRGQVVESRSMAVDITERKRAEQALRESEERLRTVISNMPVILTAIDHEGVVTLSEGKGLHALGIKPGEHVGLSVFDLHAGTPAVAEHVRRALAGEPVTARVEVAGVAFEGHIEPIRDEHGRVSGAIAVATDVTEHVLAEERLRTVVTNAPVILFATDAEGLVTLNEGQGLGTLGVKPGEHIGRSMFDLYRTLPEFTEDLRRALAGDTLTTLVERGGIAYEAHLAPVRDDGGQVSGLIGVATDVTERKRTEEALRESEERLRTVVANAPVILFATDREGVFTLSEGKGLRALGLNPGEAVGQSVFDRYRDVPQVTQYLQRALDGEASTASGEVGEVSFEAHLAPLRDEQGQVSGVIGVATDVTERRQAEEALRLRDEAMASSVSAIAFADADRRVTYANDSCLRAWGYDNLREILGRPITEFWQLGKRGGALLKTLRTKGSWVGELPAQRRDGSVFDAHVSMTQARDEAGRPLGMMASFEDISERKQAEEELRRISDLKSEFVALVSHELRAPLTNLSGGLELLAQDVSSLPTRDRRAVALLSREYVRLSTLVESILDMSRLDAGQLSLTFGPVWLEPVIAGVAVSVSGAGLRHPIDVDIPRGLPPVWADETYLEQVLRNLVRNAGRYSATGQPVVIQARTEGDTLVISVTDRGPGVSREEQERIFDAFYRGESSAQSPAGYGLGLYFARKLVEEQGGAIRVKSPAFDDPTAPGATFTVTLPIAHDEA